MNDRNISKLKKTLALSIIVALVSQVYINFFVPEFKFSIAIILFPVFILSNPQLNIYQMTLFTTIFVYISRVLGDVVINGIINGVLVINKELLLLHVPDTFFYATYGILFNTIINNNPTFHLNRLFISILFCDYFANIIEIYTIVLKGETEIYSYRLMEILFILLLVAILRSSIVYLVLKGLKYYRMFILKKEHEERYKRLLWLISLLKTEAYWMKRNMAYIETVMSNAYELFEKISQNKEPDIWANLSLTIAKDVHEVKKEYNLVFRGIEEIMDNKLQEQAMSFKDIISILYERIAQEVRYREQKIDLIFDGGNNFYTQKHYYLMSVFRNIIMNAIDAISLDKRDSKISFTHQENEYHHIFVIEDTGSGIKSEDLEFIFSPGFSTKIDYNTGNINRGLGLSLVKDIVEEYLQGKIEVYSTQGKGSVFKIYIPKELLEVNET